MIHLLIPKEEAQKINEERFNYNDPLVSCQLRALYLKHQGCSHQEICQYVGLSPNALTTTLKKFEKYPTASLKQACEDIEKLMGIKKKRERVRVFLHQMGMKPRKVGGIPAKAAPGDSLAKSVGR